MSERYKCDTPEYRSEVAKAMWEGERAGYINGVNRGVAFERHRSRPIPVGERLPEEGRPVLAWDHVKCWYVAWVNGETWLTDFGKIGVGVVTHWQPLPPAPE